MSARRTDPSPFRAPSPRAQPTPNPVYPPRSRIAPGSSTAPGSHPSHRHPPTVRRPPPTARRPPPAAHRPHNDLLGADNQPRRRLRDLEHRAAEPARPPPRRAHQLQPVPGHRAHARVLRRRPLHGRQGRLRRRPDRHRLPPLRAGPVPGRRQRRVGDLPRYGLLLLLLLLLGGGRVSAVMTWLTWLTCRAPAAPSDTPALAARSSASGASAASLRPACAPSFNATALLTIFDTWMTGTNTDLGARILLLTLHLHPAGANQTASSSSAAQPLADTLRSANILADAYTPTRLLSDRANLNSSWHGGGDSADPTTAPTNTTYFTVAADPDPDGDGDFTAATPDGWPSEAYLEFRLGKRVLVSFGAVHPALPYDPAATGDDATIFPSDYLGAAASYNASSSSSSSSPPSPPPCLFDAAAPSVAAANASWATVSYHGGGGDDGGVNVTALVNCGYSTVLVPEAAAGANASLEARFAGYEAHIRATAAWAWAEGQPQNTTGRAESFRCAAMSARDGRWSVADCEESRHAACRIDGEPYKWSITPTPYSYYAVPPSNTTNSTTSTSTSTCTFSAPRTPLENAHLLSALQHSAAVPLGSIWLDLNSLAVDSCWVSGGGANASCPYGPAADDGNREVIVSAVAAVIVLVVFGLMWFAKGASWRVERSRRRRRRAAKKRVREGVEYEGVPS